MNQPLQALVCRLQQEVGGQVDEEQRDVLIQLLVHGFGLHAARQGLGELAKQRGFKLLEGGIDTQQLLQAGAPWGKAVPLTILCKEARLTPQRTLNPVSVHNL